MPQTNVQRDLHRAQTTHRDVVGDARVRFLRDQRSPISEAQVGGSSPSRTTED